MRMKREEWRGHIEAWKRSGLTQVSYCKREGLPLASFRSHKMNMKKESSKEDLKFFEVGFSKEAETVPMFELKLEKDFRVSIRLNLTIQIDDWRRG